MRSVQELQALCRHSFVTMESPHYPTYSKQGVSAPVEDLLDLNYGTSSIENLRELQKYSEKLSYESTCCRLRAEGIQTHIKVHEHEKVHNWIEGMTEDLLRMKRAVCPASLDVPNDESIATSPSECSIASSVFQLSIYGAGETSSSAQESFHGSSPSECIFSTFRGNGSMGRNQEAATALVTDIHETLRDVQLQKRKEFS